MLLHRPTNQNLLRPFCSTPSRNRFRITSRWGRLVVILSTIVYSCVSFLWPRLFFLCCKYFCCVSIYLPPCMFRAQKLLCYIHRCQFSNFVFHHFSVRSPSSTLKKGMFSRIFFATIKTLLRFTQFKAKEVCAKAPMSGEQLRQVEIHFSMFYHGYTMVLYSGSAV